VVDSDLESVGATEAVLLGRWRRVGCPTLGCARSSSSVSWEEGLVASGRLGSPAARLTIGCLGGGGWSGFPATMDNVERACTITYPLRSTAMQQWMIPLLSEWPSLRIDLLWPSLGVGTQHHRPHSPRYRGSSLAYLFECLGQDPDRQPESIVCVFVGLVDS
jgi:hypothetical protein